MVFPLRPKKCRIWCDSRESSWIKSSGSKGRRNIYVGKEDDDGDSTFFYRSIRRLSVGFFDGFSDGRSVGSSSSAVGMSVGIPGCWFLCCCGIRNYCRFFFFIFFVYCKHIGRHIRGCLGGFQSRFVRCRCRCRCRLTSGGRHFV